jgi:antitoxin component of MazEF toxin-antitoxin module
MKKLQKKGITATIGVLGDSFIVRIPKEIAETLKLVKGMKAVLSMNAPNNLVISVGE